MKGKNLLSIVDGSERPARPDSSDVAALLNYVAGPKEGRLEWLKLRRYFSSRAVDHEDQAGWLKVKREMLQEIDWLESMAGLHRSTRLYRATATLIHAYSTDYCLTSKGHDKVQPQKRLLATFEKAQAVDPNNPDWPLGRAQTLCHSPQIRDLDAAESILKDVVGRMALNVEQRALAESLLNAIAGKRARAAKRKPKV